MTQFLTPEERAKLDQGGVRLRAIGRDDRPDALPFEYLSELDAARYFANEYGDCVRHCEAAGGWLLWDGKRWKLDDDGGIYRLAAGATDKICALATESNINDEDRRKLFNFAIALRKKRGLDNVIALAATEANIAVGDPSRFDSNRWLLNVENGTIDLRTGILRPHDRTDLITKLIPLRFDSTSPCDRWLSALNEIFDQDQEIVNFVQRATGYSLTGVTTEHAFLVLYGTGKNGKSTLLALIGEVLGEYAMTAAPETFVNRQPGAPTNDLARLRGARFVAAMETSEGRALAESFVKTVTGGDRITVRRLYCEHFEFWPTFKLWLGTNHKPVIKGGDDGIWRRVRLIPFERRFDGERADPNLREKLETELPGILAWAVRGCLEWQKHGLPMPQAVADATASYRSEMDTLRSFIEERCTIDSHARALAGALYREYRLWAEAAGEKPLSQRWFGLRLSERGFTAKRSRNQRTWEGVGLRQDGEHDVDGVDDSLQYGRATLV